jgi:hypothetical protein
MDSAPEQDIADASVVEIELAPESRNAASPMIVNTPSSVAPDRLTQHPSFVAEIETSPAIEPETTNSIPSPDDAYSPGVVTFTLVANVADDVNIAARTILSFAIIDVAPFLQFLETAVMIAQTIKTLVNGMSMDCKIFFTFLRGTDFCSIIRGDETHFSIVCGLDALLPAFRGGGQE